VIRRLIEKYKRWGLTINTQKTKCLCIGVEIENLVIEGNKEVRTYKEYKYLEITLNREGTDDHEISNRITKARRIIAYLNDILWSIMKKKEFSIYETMVKSVMAAKWRLIERSRRTLATKMNAIRRSMRISRRQKVKNEEVKQRIEIENLMMELDESWMNGWCREKIISLVQRMNENKFSKQVVEWISPGKWKKGRPRTRYGDKWEKFEGIMKQQMRMAIRDQTAQDVPIRNYIYIYIQCDTNKESLLDIRPPWKRSALEIYKKNVRSGRRFAIGPQFVMSWRIWGDEIAIE